MEFFDGPTRLASWVLPADGDAGVTAEVGPRPVAWLAGYAAPFELLVREC